MKPKHGFAESSAWFHRDLSLAALLFAAVVLTGGSARAQSYQVLHSFSGSDGADPIGELFQDAAGNLYGTTSVGGSGWCADSDGFCGVAYKLDPAGHQTVLYTFDREPNGYAPYGLIGGSGGFLYGVATEGGDHSKCNDRLGCGTVYSLSAGGNQSVLFTFEGFDGEFPQAGLLRDRTGNLYGTTTSGGPGRDGTVFKLDTSGKETVLYSFTGNADGNDPSDALTPDEQGNLYGATEQGGNLSACPTLGCGVIYRINATGGETPLYTFTGGTDGWEPGGKLIRDSAGNLYGATFIGGDSSCSAPFHNGCGVVFKIDSNGVETVLHTFGGEPEDGAHPIGDLARDAAGNLYGATYQGGAYGNGAVFKLDPSGHESLLYSFTGGSDGAFPQGGVIIDAAGNIYGTASQSGSGCFLVQGCGVVFEITP